MKWRKRPVPRLVKTLKAGDLQRRGGGTSKLDLELYSALLADLQVGEGAEIAVEPEEKQRLVKRRFSLAAARRGLGLKWRTPTKEGHLRFQLLAEQRQARRLSA